MPNDEHLQNYLNNLMRVSGNPDPKVADAADNLSHKTTSLHEHRNHDEVEMRVVQSVPKGSLHEKKLMFGTFPFFSHFFVIALMGSASPETNFV